MSDAKLTHEEKIAFIYNRFKDEETFIERLYAFFVKDMVGCAAMSLPCSEEMAKRFNIDRVHDYQKASVLGVIEAVHQSGWQLTDLLQKKEKL